MTKFKVGDWWRTRGGWYEQIESLSDGDEEYPMTTTKGDAYTSSGRYISEYGKHAEDLVQKMKTPVWEEDDE